MKKILAILISTMLIITFTFPVYANYDDATQIDGWTLAIKRFTANQQGKTPVETATSILKELGMNDSFINLLSVEKKMEIYNSTFIKKSTEYAKITSEGIQIPLSEEKYLQELIVTKNTSTSNIQPFAQGDSWAVPDDGKDSLLVKEMIIFETKNSPKGTFGIILGFSFKNFVIRYRGEDIISLSGEYLIFNRNSFAITEQYVYTQTTSSGTTAHTQTNYYGPNDLEDPNDLLQSNNGISYQFNLPNNIYTLQSSLLYTDATFLITVSSLIAFPNSKTSFNVYGNYFHRKIELFIDPTISINGANVSVSPKLLYDQHQIRTEEPITYTP